MTAVKDTAAVWIIACVLVAAVWIVAATVTKARANSRRNQNQKGIQR